MERGLEKRQHRLPLVGCGFASSQGKSPALKVLASSPLITFKHSLEGCSSISGKQFESIGTKRPRCQDGPNQNVCTLSYFLIVAVL